MFLFDSLLKQYFLQLFKWLEKEVEMLKEVCEYESGPDETVAAAMEEPEQIPEYVSEET